MRRLSGLFADRPMLFGWNDRLIRCPEIGIARSTPIGAGYRTPELATRGFTPITDHKCHNLAGFPTKSEPDPRFIDLLADE